MFKKIEVLDKEKFKNVKFKEVDSKEVAKNIGLIPLGFDEVIEVASYCPVIISAKENGEFLAFTGITKDITIYNDEKLYIPGFATTYPFISINVKGKDGKANSIIGIDNNEEYVGVSKKVEIFKKDELTKEANDKIEAVRALNRRRDIAKKVIAEFSELDLLVKKDFKIINDGKEQTLINEFYIINREKVNKLDDKTLASWAKKGWITLIDCHLKSLTKFETVLKSQK